MTEEQLEAIKARLAALADDEMWEASTDWHHDVGIYSAWATGRFHYTTSGDATEDEMQAVADLAESDAVLIAHARDDMRALIEALEAARTRIAALETELAKREQVREGILADMQARYVRLPNVNADAGQEG